jgi:monooxygenase
VNTEHFDVLIIGAGLSGIGAACHLQKKCPGKNFSMLEARDCIGGTWDLFRYPGVRSDSDMFTLGYSFRPWTGTKSIADGASILQYIRDTAREHGVDRKIQFEHRVTRVSWCSEHARWNVQAERGTSKEPVTLSCNFLIMCSGYYSYAAGYSPDFAGIGRFKGQIVQPQHWNDDVAYAGKRVVVIGSGATAVTLAPELAKSSSSVTLLQRSPTYIAAWPDEDRIANALRRWLPVRAAYAIARWKNVATGMYFYRICRRNPDRARAMILEGVRSTLGPDYDAHTHFTPRYDPWSQRLCLAPNDNFYQSIRDGRITMVTDEIERFVENGIKLRSGGQLDAEVVVAATGLSLQLMGGAEIEVDDRPVDMPCHLSYMGVLLSDVPNLASVFGYTNASWTLKADLISGYVCRLLNFMDAHGYSRCIPRNSDPAMKRLPAVDFSSGYFQRAMDKLPKQGARKPWRINQDYFQDLWDLRFAPIDDSDLEFS